MPTAENRKSYGVLPNDCKSGPGIDMASEVMRKYRFLQPPPFMVEIEKGRPVTFDISISEYTNHPARIELSFKKRNGCTAYFALAMGSTNSYDAMLAIWYGGMVLPEIGPVPRAINWLIANGYAVWTE